MNRRDWIFILLCIFLVVIIAVYVYKVEMFKINFEDVCLKNIFRTCICGK